VGGICDVSNREVVITCVASAHLSPARIVHGLGREGHGSAKEAVGGCDADNAQAAAGGQQCSGRSGDPHIAARKRVLVV
jgi:hypothetical protein